MSESDTDKKYVELDALFKRADDVVATSVIGRPRRGSGYIPKVDAKIRLNAEVMEWLRAMGPRHYSRINGLLTALMEVEKQAREQDTEQVPGRGPEQAPGQISRQIPGQEPQAVDDEVLSENSNTGGNLS